MPRAAGCAARPRRQRCASCAPLASASPCASANAFDASNTAHAGHTRPPARCELRLTTAALLRVARRAHRFDTSGELTGTPRCKAKALRCRHSAIGGSRTRDRRYKTVALPTELLLLMDQGEAACGTLPRDFQRERARRDSRARSASTMLHLDLGTARRSRDAPNPCDPSCANRDAENDEAPVSVQPTGASVRSPERAASNQPSGLRRGLARKSALPFECTTAVRARGRAIARDESRHADV